MDLSSMALMQKWLLGPDKCNAFQICIEHLIEVQDESKSS